MSTTLLSAVSTVSVYTVLIVESELNPFSEFGKLPALVSVCTNKEPTLAAATDDTTANLLIIGVIKILSCYIYNMVVSNCF